MAKSSPAERTRACAAAAARTPRRRRIAAPPSTTSVLVRGRLGREERPALGHLTRSGANEGVALRRVPNVRCDGVTRARGGVRFGMASPPVVTRREGRRARGPVSGAEAAQLRKPQSASVAVRPSAMPPATSPAAAPPPPPARKAAGAYIKYDVARADRDQRRRHHAEPEDAVRPRRRPQSARRSSSTIVQEAGERECRRDRCTRSWRMYKYAAIDNHDSTLRIEPPPS